MDINDQALQIHAENVAKGWWDKWPNKADRYQTAMMLVVSELSEAMEGDITKFSPSSKTVRKPNHDRFYQF